MRLFVIAAVVAAIAPAALAQDAGMANVIGNTLTSKSPDGMVSKIVYKADHTFSGAVPALNFTFQGKWEAKGDEVCRTYAPAIPNRANPECSPMLPWLAVGQSFEAPNGLTVSLTAGAQ